MNIFADFQTRVAAILRGIMADGRLPGDLDLSRFVVEPTKDPAHGDLATNAAMVYAREAKASFPNPRQLATEIAYALAQTLEQVLRKCGDDLTRENIMRNAANLGAFKPGILIPGVRIEPRPADYLVVRDMRLEQFDGVSYQSLGPPVEMTR